MSSLHEDPAATITLRALTAQDVTAVAAIDALHTGASKPGYWRRVLPGYLGPSAEDVDGAEDGGEAPRLQVGLGAEVDGELAAYLLGEVRAFEFGSEPCGWIHSVGVDPKHLRRGLASELLAEACARFAAEGHKRVRTMVRRNDVPVQSMFRSNGFVGGSFVQLELSLTPSTTAKVK